ncbi:MAG: hypothetical protein JNJ73_04730 [Hyphomonadaceae bacterium]|nr:hypothetical protein [Hyphomonadaceae bacterium]
MPDGSSGAMKYVILWFRLLFGAHLIYSALRHYLGFEVLSRVDHPIGGPFVRILAEMGIYELVKFTELVTGLLIFFGRLVPLALIAEFPITIVIFILNTFIVAQPRQLYSGPQELFLNTILIVFYGRYYMPLLRFNAPPRPIWTARWSDTKLP